MKLWSLSALLIGGLCASALGGTPSASLNRLRTMSAAGEQARSLGDREAYEVSQAAWNGRHQTQLSTSLVSSPPEGTIKNRLPLAVLGDSKKGAHAEEPPDPLDKDNKPKPQKSGKRLWWGLGGAAAGAGLGFLLGGPIGALIGGLLGGAAGFFFGP